MMKIHHDGLVLRAFEDSDAPAFAAAARESAGTVGQWMPWCHADYTEQDALGWFEICRSGESAGTAHDVGIFDEATSELLGGAGLNEINRLHAVCNLGYWVRQSRQRQKIASRCVRALTEHAFVVLRLKRVEIVVAVGNLPSHAVAQQSGALLECVARNRLVVHGDSVPASVFSLVPDANTSP
jgi:RimJ/RimL family protein N-acetyltransferase